MNTVRDALYNHLTATPAVTGLLGDGPEGVYHRVAPVTARLPYVVFYKMSGLREWTFDGPPLVNQIWTVKAVDRGESASPAEDIAAAIETALTDAPLALTGNTLLYCRPEQDIDYGEPDGGETYFHCGLTFRVMTDSA